MTLSELFKNIADAIRGKDGTTDTILATDFASRIEAIETSAVPSFEKDRLEQGYIDTSGTCLVVNLPFDASELVSLELFGTYPGTNATVCFSINRDAVNGDPNSQFGARLCGYTTALFPPSTTFTPNGNTLVSVQTIAWFNTYISFMGSNDPYVRIAD